MIAILTPSTMSDTAIRRTDKSGSRIALSPPGALERHHRRFTPHPARTAGALRWEAVISVVNGLLRLSQSWVLRQMPRCRSSCALNRELLFVSERRNGRKGISVVEWIVTKIFVVKVSDRFPLRVYHHGAVSLAPIAGGKAAVAVSKGTQCVVHDAVQENALFSFIRASNSCGY